ncbi:hypothetical protein PHLCEN_2v3263 [Hermanssonia centrifuga]|uniref:Uncharacterized protein n=1 Tax=Hermanssonia centrifuga TaxID=98765 RepID=A0A2R6QUI7_9APHY|nr:hypothetical protein PHLCEN_2v3263 [Hermanssonia centrifuga]
MILKQQEDTVLLGQKGSGMECQGCDQAQTVRPIGYHQGRRYCSRRGQTGRSRVDTPSVRGENIRR